MLAYLQEPLSNFLIVIIIGTFYRALYSVLIFKLDNEKIKLDILLKFVLTMTLVHLLPAYLSNYCFFIGSPYYDNYLNFIFTLQVPLVFFVYYYFIKIFFKKSSFESIILSRYLFLTINLLIIFHIVFRLFFLKILGSHILFFGNLNFFLADSLAQIAVIPFIFVEYFVLKKLMLNFRKHIADSNSALNYSQSPFYNSLPVNFLFTCFYYILGYLAVCWIANSNIGILYKSISVLFILLLTYVLIYLWDEVQMLLNIVRTKDIHISSLIDSTEKTSEIKRDIGDIIQTYEGYIRLKKYDALERYHQQTLKTIATTSNMVAVSRIFRNNPVMISLLSKKLQLAEKAGVNFSYYINDMKNIAVLQTLELSKIIDSLLDNAIEEAVHTNTKIVHISIEKNCDFLLVTISNSIADEEQAAQILNKTHNLIEPKQTFPKLRQLLKLIFGDKNFSVEYNHGENKFTIHLKTILS